MLDVGGWAVRCIMKLLNVHLPRLVLSVLFVCSLFPIVILRVVRRIAVVVRRLGCYSCVIF